MLKITLQPEYSEDSGIAIHSPACGLYAITIDGRELATVSADDGIDRALEIVRDAMETHQYWPDLWIVGERGDVQLIDQHGNHLSGVSVTLDSFTEAYIDCLLWSECDDNGEPLEDSFDVWDISPQSLREIIDDCQDFQEAQAEHLEELDDSDCGHDFCLTRNGHGAGFWDRGYGELGERLSVEARAYGTQGLTPGDDGLLYIHG